MENYTERFTGKAGVYEKYRPDYAAACVDFIVRVCGWKKGSRIADLGAGTGIFTRQLLDAGFFVTAVEPGEDMRAALSESLGEHPNLSVLDTPAERTGLPSHSLDGITAAQSFHWFDPAAFLMECRRVLQPDGWVALVWNMRDPEHPLTQETADICRRHCPDFRGFSNSDGWQTQNVSQVLGEKPIFRRFPHSFSLDEAGYIGRYLSASYAPKPGDASYIPYINDLQAVFRKHAGNGRLLFPNTTCCYIGRPFFSD